MLDANKTPDQWADDFVHGLLEPHEVKMFEERCESDATFREALGEAQRRKEAMKSLPPAEASEELIRQTMARVESHVTGRRKFWRTYRNVVLFTTAASILIIAGLHYFFFNLKPSPYDVRILGQSELLSGTNAALRVAVFDRRSGKLVSGVPVKVTLVNSETGETAEVAKFASSDSPGSAGQLKLPSWSEGDYELRVVASPEGGSEILTRHVQLTRSWRLMLSSDKPVYQPGQAIHLRSLALRKPDLKPVSEEDIVFSITDPKGNVIFKQQAKTSQFGIAATDCAMATEILEGEYFIECRVGDTTANQTVKVERYVLPKFKVDIAFDKPFYQPGETVSGKVQADYFFGQPVAQGEVKLDVRGVDAGNFIIADITEKADDKGTAKFQFSLPKKLFGREQEGGNAKFMLVATVTDTVGQKYSRGAERIVTAQPIQLEVIPESGSLVKDVANKVYLFASYADGRPAMVDVTINGEIKFTTSKLGVGQFELTPKSNDIDVTIKAIDKEGREGRRHARLVVGQIAGDFVLRTDKATYNGGETMTLTAIGGGVEPVFVDFIKDGQSILTQSLELKNGRGEVQMDLPAEMFGTIEVVGYRFGPAGLAVRKNRLIFVRQAKELVVKAALDKEEYRPGVKAKLNLTLTDADGKPVAGAISLAAVDEAVFSVLAQRPGMAETFFLLEQELLEPVYAIYNWDPFASPGERPEELIEFERAIFSRATGVTTGWEAVPQEFIAPTKEQGAQNAGGVAAWRGDFAAEPMMGEAMPAEVPGGGAFIAARDAGPSPFTLAAASFPEKQQNMMNQRENGLIGVAVAWASLVGLLIVAGLAAFAIARPKQFLITMGALLVLAMLGSLFLPAVQMAREATGRADMMEFAVGAAPMAAWEGNEVLVEEMAIMEDQPSEMTLGQGEARSAGASARPRVRQHFPETLLWVPQLVTNDAGEASLEVDLADSITTWRLSTSAVSAAGQLGGSDFPIRVFQPFFVDLDLPVSLTRGDEVSVPVIAYSYLDKPQKVELQIEPGDWFTRLNDAGEPIGDNPPIVFELAAGEKKASYVRLRVKDVGKQQLQVTALGSGMSDALRRDIEVVPNGRKVEQVVSGSLNDPAELTLLLPEDAIEGSSRAIVKIYPSSFSQLVEGLDAIFQMPYGCFEQTSSTTYPNILALDYLRRTKLSAPEIEAKARQYIHLGYQRLVSFEVNGGGFDWFGNPPANVTLTAYGLMEFEDMARVHDVDPNLINRTRQWLLSKREPDGRWKGDPSMLNDGLAGSVQRGKDIDLATTAYVAWAVFGTGQANSQAGVTLDYLLAQEPASIDSPYVLAIIANCIAAVQPNHKALPEYFAKLETLKKSDDAGKLVWWEQPQGDSTMFYGSGQSGNIETTAMVVLAMLKSNQGAADVRKALAWLVTQKDPQGTWHSTQATVLALKALITGTTSTGGDKPRQFEITLDGKPLKKLDVAADQADVLQQINLTEFIKPGPQTLKLAETSGTGSGFQVNFWHYVDVIEPPMPMEPEPLTINLTYDREKLVVDETVGVKAVVVNNAKQDAPMVILDLPIPGGFRMEAVELEKLIAAKSIAKYQITARKAIVYLRGLKPGEQLELQYQLKATMPVKVAVPAGEAYEYYDPAKKASGGATNLEATIEA